MSSTPPEQGSLFPTSSAGASRANHFQSQESSEAKTMTVTSGRKCYESSVNPSLDGLLERTFLGSSAWHSTMCHLTWRTKATKSGRLYYQLVPSMRSTEETGSSSSPTESNLWATPSTMDYLPQRSPEALDKLKQGQRKGRSRPSNLREQVDPQTMERWLWPTPTVKKQSLWPTPLTRDYKGGRSPETLKAKGRTPTNSLPDSVTHQEGQSGPLNPQWVEWLMGFPIGHTDLKPSEMPSSRKSSRKSGAQSSKRSNKNA